MSEQLIHKAMLSIMRGIGAIKKSKEVTFGEKYKYRGIDQVYEAVHPLMIEFGVYMTAEILDRHREERQTARGGAMIYTQLRMRYHFHAEDGSSVLTEVEGEGMDTSDKSSNKAMSVAHKYAILQAFCVPTEDFEDADKEKHDLKPRQVPAKQQAPATQQTPPKQQAAPPQSSAQIKSDSDGTTSLRIAKVEERLNKDGKPFLSLRATQALSSGKPFLFVKRAELFDAMRTAEGEDCMVVFDPKQPDFPTVIDVKLIGDTAFRNGKPVKTLEQELEIGDDDPIPF